MSDFRLPLLDEDIAWEEEVDWNSEQRRWTGSARDYRLGAPWEQDISPKPRHLIALRAFFFIQDFDIDDQTLLTLSPGELTLVSHNTGQEARVHAFLCKECGKHWLVFRRSENGSSWQVYGRDCNYSWRRGDAPTQEELAMLNTAGIPTQRADQQNEVVETK